MKEKLSCPSCAQALSLPDKLVGKLVKCPACQKSFSAMIPNTAPENADLVANNADSVSSVSEAAPSSVADDLTLRITDEWQYSDAPPAITNCPYCNTIWKSGESECRKCHYNVIIGKRMHRQRSRVSLNFNYQKLFLYAALIGAVCGIYWLFNNWHCIRDTVNTGLDNASRNEPTADDSSVMTRKSSAPKKKLSRD